MTIEEKKQLLTPGRRIELFDWDATSIGGSTYNFVSGYAEDQPLMWRGLAYTPIPIKASGFEVNGQGSLPTPKLQISNILLLPGTIISAQGDPLGAKITRWVTFSDFLDDGPTPSEDEHFIPQVFYIERKSMQNRIYVEFELASAMDHHGRQLPKRQVVRDTCPLIYRRWDAGVSAFDYSDATCPYAGSTYFKANGDATANPSEDACGKRLGECRKRFGRSTPLPFGSYPAAARIR